MWNIDKYYSIINLIGTHTSQFLKSLPMLVIFVTQIQIVYISKKIILCLMNAV